MLSTQLLSYAHLDGAGQSKQEGEGRAAGTGGLQGLRRASPSVPEVEAAAVPVCHGSSLWAGGKCSAPGPRSLKPLGETWGDCREAFCSLDLTGGPLSHTTMVSLPNSVQREGSGVTSLWPFSY